MAINIKNLGLSFGFITVIGLASSWLSSCAQSEAATSDDQLHIVLNQSVQDIHTQVTEGATDGTVANKLNQILGSLNGQGGGSSGNSGNVLTLISKLSDDIGLMSERIVKTEELIVSVIALESNAATGVINSETQSAVDLNGNKFMSSIPPVTETVFDKLMRVAANAGPNPPVLSEGASSSPSASTPPTLNISGNNGQYELLVGDNPRFIDGYVNQVVDPTASPSAPNSIDSVWSNAISALNSNGSLTQVFIAVRAIDANMQLSGISNSLKILL